MNRINQLNWEPISLDGHEFKTHKMKQLSPGKIIFTGSLELKIFYGFLMALGLSVPIVYSLKGELDTTATVIGIVIFVVALIFFLRTVSTLVFDKSMGYFYMGDKSSVEKLENHGKTYCRIVEIQALQLLKKKCYSNNTSYSSYELNLVLQNGSRINVVDHGDKKVIDRDIKKLATFLNVEIYRYDDNK